MQLQRVKYCRWITLESKQVRRAKGWGGGRNEIHEEVMDCGSVLLLSKKSVTSACLKCFPCIIATRPGAHLAWPGSKMCYRWVLLKTDRCLGRSQRANFNFLSSSLQLLHCNPFRREVGSSGSGGGICCLLSLTIILWLRLSAHSNTAFSLL